MGDGTEQTPARSHRLHWFAGRTHQVLDDLGDPAVWAMNAAERAETLTELLALRARIDAHVLAVIAEADQAGDASAAGATTTAGWLRAMTRVTGAQASRLVKDATALESHDQVAVALREGSIHRDQATVITQAVDALPEEVSDRT